MHYIINRYKVPSLEHRKIRSGKEGPLIIRFMRALWFLAALASAATAAFGQNEPFHVLAFYSTHVEQDHVDFAMQAIPFFKAMSERDQFDFEVTSNWADMNPTVLKMYQV